MRFVEWIHRNDEIIKKFPLEKKLQLFSNEKSPPTLTRWNTCLANSTAGIRKQRSKYNDGSPTRERASERTSSLPI